MTLWTVVDSISHSATLWGCCSLLTGLAQEVHRYMLNQRWFIDPVGDSVSYSLHVWVSPEVRPGSQHSTRDQGPCLQAQDSHSMQTSHIGQ